MIVTILGGLVVAGGVLLLLADPVMGVVGIAAGVGVILWNKKLQAKKEVQRQEQVSNEIQGYAAAIKAPPAPVAKPDGTVKTFTFPLAGVVFRCKYAREDRQDIIDQTELGDPLTLRQYEWEGEPALAVMNPEAGADIGVVPARDVDHVLELMEKYDLFITVVEKREFEYKDDYRTGCKIRICCMNK